MKGKQVIIGLMGVMVLFSPLFVIDLSAYSAGDIRVVRISGKDEKAVISMAGNDLQLVKKGDVLEGVGKIIEIAEGRIIIKAEKPEGPETIIIRFENGKQRIERISKFPDKEPEMRSFIHHRVDS